MSKITALAILALALATCTPGVSQANPNLESYFKKYIELTDGQIESGVKGSIVRKTGVSRSVSSLRKSLAALKDTLEHEQ
jgi:hypothetical protein